MRGSTQGKMYQENRPLWSFKIVQGDNIFKKGKAVFFTISLIIDTHRILSRIAEKSEVPFSYPILTWRNVNFIVGKVAWEKRGPTVSIGEGS